MPLEVATYINDLVPANPVPADPKSQGDDHLRLLKATIKQTLNGFTGAILLTATDTGTAAAHVLTPATALVGYTPMLCLLYQPAVTNTGAITVNVSGLGAKSIKTLAGADPTAGDIVAGAPVLLMYNGTNFSNLAGSEFLSKTGSQTLTGNLTLAGALAVTGATTLPANTSIGAVSAAEIAFVDGATSPIQAQIDAKGAIAGQSWTGAQNFTGATPTGPTPAAGDNSAKFATTAFAVALAFQSALPAQAGNAGKFITTNGTIANWGTVTPPSVVRSARTSNTILGAADSMALIDITSGTFTQTFTAAATLASGWFVYIRNSGTGDITLDPNASELIDGMTSYVMYPGEARLVQCDGAAFTSVVLSPYAKSFTTSNAAAPVPPGYKFHGRRTIGGGGSGGTGGGGGSGSIFSSAPGGWGGGGGSAGSSGASAIRIVDAALLGVTEAVVIGAGGASQTAVGVGGAGVTGSSGGAGTAGTAGNAGGTSSSGAGTVAEISSVGGNGGGVGALGTGGSNGVGGGASGAAGAPAGSGTNGGGTINFTFAAGATGAVGIAGASGSSGGAGGAGGSTPLGIFNLSIEGGAGGATQTTASPAAGNNGAAAAAGGAGLGGGGSGGGSGSRGQVAAGTTGKGGDSIASTAGGSGQVNWWGVA